MAAGGGDLNDIGVFGLAVMGQNLALNIVSKGFNVSVCNRSPDKVDATVARYEEERKSAHGKADGEFGRLSGHKDAAEFLRSLAVPRKVIILVQAGAPVDATLSVLSSHMQPGDILVDGGNEWFPNSIRRGAELSAKGLHFVGMGVSGGEEGARHGPSLMPGGPREAYEALEPILTKIAAKADGEACVTYVGELGSGNYVKMVHNGIEYGDMQLIAEAYNLLKTVGGLNNEELAKVFDDYNAGELESFLIEITAKIFRKKEDEGVGYVVDKILDKTGMKGTGKWTVQEGAERAIPLPTIAAALDARVLAAMKEERVAASKIISGPSAMPSVDRGQLVDDVRQGMNLIREAARQLDWHVSLGELARIWKGGCIIRARFLDRIKGAYDRNKDLPNLLLDPQFAEEVNARQQAWRRVTSLCIACGIPAPSFTASLTYLDSYRHARLPANLTQAQRDFFGAHTYERTDKEGVFHTEWTK